MKNRRDQGVKGTILQLQDFSVHDGDGIRTTIFFAGCPLRCKWCANPESWTFASKLAFFQEKCTGCGRCKAICPQGLYQGMPSEQPGDARQHFVERIDLASSCTVCGLCAKRCPQGALTVMGSSMTVEEIVKQVQRDSLFYGPSGGGVTFSGGEATVQMDFLRELTEELYQRGISLWLETCGSFRFEEVRDVLEKMDHIFFDLKHMDSQLHMEMTGKGNEEILENCKAVYEMGIPLTLRIPAIPGINLTVENLRETAGFVREVVPRAELELLPYHAYGVPKYKALRMAEVQEFTVPVAEQMEWASQYLADCGVKIVEYR